MPHAYDTHLRTSHLLDRLAESAAGPRLDGQLAPSADGADGQLAPAADGADGHPVAQVIALRRPTARPSRDGARRSAALSALDSQYRLSLRQVLAELGWNAKTELVAAVEDGRGLIRAGRYADQLGASTSQVDSNGTLQTSPLPREQTASRANETQPGRARAGQMHAAEPKALERVKDASRVRRSVTPGGQR